MRQLIVYMRSSLDGFISGPNGELDWVMDEDPDSWKRVFGFLEDVDTCVLGRVMYPEYADYWISVLANPSAPMPLSGKPASKEEIRYARWADKTPHIVVSKTLDKAQWKNTVIVRDLEEIRKLKQQPGKNIYVVGGATLVSSLMNAGLVDQVQLAVYPMVLGGGKALFKDVKGRHPLELVESQQAANGKMLVAYRTGR